MLAIRLQRTGRSGHAQFRVIVQDSRFSPKRGRIVEYLGSYDPHTKTATFDSQKAAKYMENGAQPSGRVARLLQKEGVKLPAWVKLSEPQKRTVRHPDKRRSTRPPEAEAPAPAPTETPSEELAAVTETTEAGTPDAQPTPEAASEERTPAEPATEEALAAGEPVAADEAPAEQPATEEAPQDKAE